MTSGRTRGQKARRAAGIIAIAWFVFDLSSGIATAQIGNILKKAGEIKKKADDVHQQLTISDEQEQEIGADVSQRIRDRYGVVQDVAVTRYVSLVGTVLAQASSRPGLPWKFIVLDTDGVNAFAAPGGYIHITRGALALMTSEAELATVLGHEITHVTEKHTIQGIQQGKIAGKGFDLLRQKADLKRGSEYFNKLAEAATDAVLKGFGRSEELESDQKGVRLANSIGYAPRSLVDFLTRLAERNKDSTTKQGLFASHPDMQERISRLRNQVASERLAGSATLPERYRKFIAYQPTGLADIAGGEEGAAGLAGSSTKQTDKQKATKNDPPPKKKGFGLGSLLAPGPSEKKSAEVTGSAAARGMDKELGAKGGPVKTIVAVKLTPDEIAAFKREGGLR